MFDVKMPKTLGSISVRLFSIPYWIWVEARLGRSAQKVKVPFSGPEGTLVAPWWGTLVAYCP